MSQKVSNKGAGQIIPVEKEDVPVVVETKSPADASVTECPINLVDVKGFEAYLAKLIQMKKGASDALEKAESEYNDLCTMLQDAENKKSDAQKRFDELNALVTEGTSLLNEFTNAEKAFDSSRAKVIDFLNANNTCVK
jgi:Zn-dependent M32 family carboxypeptidase